VRTKKTLVKANPGLSPTAFGMATPTEEPLPAYTDMKHYGQWTDEAGLDAAFGAAKAKLTASLTKRQQQMQQQQWSARC